MIYKRPLIIGIGSIGSILSRKIAEEKDFEKLTIIDYDVVKERNLINSEFENDDVGKKKIDVIYDKFKNKIEINKLDLKFIENKLNDIYDSDIIIDCRDFLYDRKNIDVRLFINNKSLIIDCRKCIKYPESYEGNYFWNITKDEIDLILDHFLIMLKNGKIKDLIKHQNIIKIDNDYNNVLVDEHYYPPCNDIIVDNSIKISNPEVINKLKVPKSREIKITFFDINSDVKKDTVQLDNDKYNNRIKIINSVTSLIPKYDNNSYILILQNKDEILIIPETGAA